MSSATRRSFDSGDCELLVGLTGQAADTDGTDANVTLEHGDAAEEEREERVEARALGGILPGLFRELAGRTCVAAGGRVSLPLRVQARVGRGTVHRRCSDELAVG